MFEVKLPAKKPSLPLTEVAKGLWSVADAYAGQYDFFELSPVYRKRVRRTAKKRAGRDSEDS